MSKKKYIKLEKPNSEIEKIKTIILECYNINKSRDFENVKVQLLSNETLIGKINFNLKLLPYIDYESQLYKSLYNICKKTLEEELKVKKYRYWYYYIIEFFCEIDLKKIINKRSKRLEFFSINDKERVRAVNTPMFIEPQPRFVCTSENEVIVNPKYTGKQLQRDNERFKDFKENFNI